MQTSQSYSASPEPRGVLPCRPGVIISVPFKGSKESNVLGTARPKSNTDVPAGLVFPDPTRGVSPGPLRLRYGLGSPRYIGPWEEACLKGDTAQGTPGFGKMGTRAMPCPVPSRWSLSLHLDPDPWPWGTIGKMFKERRGRTQEVTGHKGAHTARQSVWPDLKASKMKLRI